MWHRPEPSLDRKNCPEPSLFVPEYTNESPACRIDAEVRNRSRFCFRHQSCMQDFYLCIPERNVMVPDSFCDLGRVLDVATWSNDVPWAPPAPEPSGIQRNPAQLSGTQVETCYGNWRSQLSAATHMFWVRTRHGAAGTRPWDLSDTCRVLTVL